MRCEVRLGPRPRRSCASSWFTDSLDKTTSSPQCHQNIITDGGVAADASKLCLRFRFALESLHLREVAGLPCPSSVRVRSARRPAGRRSSESHRFGAIPLIKLLMSVTWTLKPFWLGGNSLKVPTNWAIIPPAGPKSQLRFSAHSS